MFDTGMRQLRFASSMLSGRPIPPATLMALVHDVRVTLETFGTPGEGAGDLLSVPDPELQADLSKRRLRRTVRHAAAHTPYYRWWFAAHDVKPESVTPETFDLVAPTPKAPLRETPTMFVSDLGRPAVATMTTGTTGTPTTVWYSQRELDVTAGLSALAFMLANDMRAQHVWFNCISSRSIATLNLARAVPLTGAAFVQLGVVTPAVALDRLAAPLHLPGKAAQATHLNLTASYLAALVQEAEDSGWRAEDFGLVELHCGGEVLTDALRTRAEEVFGAPVIDGYSMTEIMPVSGQSCAAGHLHIPPDQGLVEVLEPQTGRPADAGDIGVLTVTPYSMYRDTTMLLRYQTGDLVRPLPAGVSLECELAGVPATSRILGRLLSGSSTTLTTRDVLDVLQAERKLPLPSRFGLTETALGPELHVFAGARSRALEGRLEERVAAASLPVCGIVLHEDIEDLPSPVPVRADLREHTFERVARSVPVAA